MTNANIVKDGAGRPHDIRCPQSSRSDVTECCKSLVDHLAFARGWNAALDAVLVHCEEVREDRRTHPPTFKDGRRKMTPEDIVLIERVTVNSIKCRTESLRRTQDKKETV